jgi:uncharacterized damage-inducible protein DinB
VKTTLTFAAFLAAASVLAAQAPPAAPSFLNESKQAYTQVKNNLIRMAEKMPAENYSFKPVAEIREFGALMAHIVDAQMRTCSAMNGEAKNVDAASKKTRDEIVEAMKASFVECDKAWEGTTDANAMTVATGGRGNRSRLGTLVMMTVTHNNEEYGYAALYLRLKGVVPPSSDNAGRGGR